MKPLQYFSEILLGKNIISKSKKYYREISHDCLCQNVYTNFELQLRYKNT